jgi:hypothetical protein
MDLLGFDYGQDWSGFFPVRFWVAAGVCAVVPVLLIGLFIAWLIRADVRGHRRRRLAAPLVCPTCGYDLRATPDRCPECGAARPPTDGATVLWRRGNDEI